MTAGEIESDVGEGDGVAPSEREAEMVDVDDGPNVFVVDTVSEIEGVIYDVNVSTFLEVRVNVEPRNSEGVAVVVCKSVDEAVSL